MTSQANELPSPLIDDGRAAEILGIARQTLRNWRLAGLGPRWLRIGPRSVRYRMADVEAFAEAGERREIAR